jgi:hypothetical protein
MLHAWMAGTKRFMLYKEEVKDYKEICACTENYSMKIYVLMLKQNHYCTRIKEIKKK